MHSLHSAGIELALKIFEWLFEDGFPFVLDDGIGNEQVNRTELFGNELLHPLHIGEISHIALHNERTSAGIAYSLRGSFCLFAAAAIMEHDIRTALCKRPCNDTPKLTGCTGDKGDFVGKVDGEHGISSFSVRGWMD
jgi:hypothetical protein